MQKLDLFSDKVVFITFLSSLFISVLILVIGFISQGVFNQGNTDNKSSTENNSVFQEFTGEETTSQSQITEPDNELIYLDDLENEEIVN